MCALPYSFVFGHKCNIEGVKQVQHCTEKLQLSKPHPLTVYLGVCFHSYNLDYRPRWLMSNGVLQYVFQETDGPQGACLAGTKHLQKHMLPHPTVACA